MEELELLQFDLCPGCGERKPQGLFAMLHHQCDHNTVTYRVVSFKMRHLMQIVEGKNPMKSLHDLLSFKYIQAMPGYDTATEYEKKIYLICRQSDIRTMRRLRSYIKLEEEFESKY